MDEQSKKRSAPKIMVTGTFEAKRINHVADLCKKKKLDKKEFVFQAHYATRMSRTTLEKAYSGSIELDYDVIEKLAWFFGVGIEDILESKFE
jgi:hypothetical protein